MNAESISPASTPIAAKLAHLQAELKNVQKEFERRKWVWLEQRWFDRAPTLVRRLVDIGWDRADKMRAKTEVLHLVLDDWMEQLRDRQKDLSIFLQKQEHYEKPLFVSRARKLPEQQFIDTQIGTEREIGAYFEKLRGTVNLFLGRIERAQKALALKGPFHLTSSENLKVMLESDLQDLQGELVQVRDKILALARRIEEAHQQLERLRNGVSQMICVEDVAPSKKGTNAEAFREILRRMLPRKAPPL